MSLSRNGHTIREKAYPSASGPAKCSDKRGVG